MDDAGSVVEVVRGGVPESRHRVHVAVVDAEGRLRAASGEADLVTYWRSSAKPFQALPLVDDGAVERYGITPEELALACGSHAGSVRHVMVAESLLFRAALTGESLACGPHAPFDDAARLALAEKGLEPGRVHNNCSGKHAGMMLLARVHGWDPAEYQRPDHPVQGRILAEVARWTQVPQEVIGQGVDGCGVVTYALPLRHMALAYAALAAAARRGERGPSEVVGAMTAHPDLVAGEGRICTELMRVTAGRVFAKVGAEGVYCAGVPGAELGVALKVEDGAARAVAPAIASVLRELNLISEDDFGRLYAHAFPQLLNTRGEVTGELRPRIVLQPAADA